MYNKKILSQVMSWERIAPTTGDIWFETKYHISQDLEVEIKDLLQVPTDIIKTSPDLEDIKRNIESVLICDLNKDLLVALEKYLELLSL